MKKLNTLKGMLKGSTMRLQRELERLQADDIINVIEVNKLETKISTLKEVIDIIDTL